MVYASQADMETRFGVEELIDLTNPMGETPDAVKIEQALADAETLINVHLSSAYTLPLPETPKVLIRIAVNMARKYLHESDNRIPTEEIKENYNESLKFLKMISAGKMELGVTKEGGVVAENDTVMVQSDDRIFTKSALKGF